MGTPPITIQALLFRETLGLLASYSWQSTVTLEPTEVGQSDVDLTLPEFFREFRLRHAIAAAGDLPEIVTAIESSPSRSSGLERTESRGVIRGRLDTPRYLARRATLRSLPRRYPIARSMLTYETPENVLTRVALGEVRTAMRDNPFSPRSAEGAAASTNLRWVTDRLSHRPWDEITPDGLRERLHNEVEARIRRRQTGNDGSYRRLLDWYDEWSLDLHRIGADAQDRLVRGLMAFPASDAFWDKVFEVWCLLFVAATLDDLGWTKMDGPAALHQASGVIYTYRAPSGHDLRVRFQKQVPLPAGRWSYRDGNSLRGIPDVSIGSDSPAPFPLLIDAKNRYISEHQIARSEETYKMLGYAENFRPRVPPERVRGVLLFPSNRTRRRVLDGPGDGRLDLIAVDLAGDRATATATLADAISDWVSTADRSDTTEPGVLRERLF